MRRSLSRVPSWLDRRSGDRGLRSFRLLTGLVLAAGVIAAFGVQSPSAQQGAPGARSKARREAPPGIIVSPDPKLQVAPADPPAVGGVWTQLNNLPPVAVDNCLLMTDATVLCHEHAGLRWYRLTPSNTGSYQAGTWAYDSSMQAGYAPLYFAGAVLADGNIIIEGGEYNCATGSCTANWGTQGSFYNASTRTWTAVNPPVTNSVVWSSIGDAQSVVLADGTFMLADCCSGKAAYFNEATLTWTPVSGHQIDNYHDEENWTLLPDRRVLTVDAWPAGSTLSEIYDPVTQQWSSAGNTPVSLTDNNRSGASYEQGPGVLRPNGTVFYFGAAFGAAGHTAIFDSTTGIWTAGPDFPGSDDSADAPATLLPNGNVLTQASPGIFGSPSHWYEVDYTTGALTQVTSPSYSFSASSYYGQMLVLPTGQILQTEFSNDVRLYTSTGTYQAAWQPTITSVSSTLAPGSSYLLSGTQLNGLSQGAAYGDDWQSATNYPIVRITNTATGHVAFARTHHHSSMGVATGSQVVSTTFDVPASIELGASTIEVVANGIPSAKTNVTIQSATAPGPFSKIAPANGATAQGLSVTLSWGASSGASSYAYCVDTVDDNTCDTSWVSAGTATSAPVTGLSAGTTYYWLVRATNSNGDTNADGGTRWAFSTASAVGAFNKTAPANAATNQQTTLSLSWGASANATSYAYCVDTTNNNTCDTSWISSGAATTAQVSGLTAGATYYWQVRSTNLVGTTDADAGAWWSFSTGAKPGAFNKTSPANAATGQASTLTLSWGASSGVSSYAYCIDTVNNTTCDTSWVNAGTATSAQVSGLTAGATYYWQVRATNTFGTTDANTGTWWSLTTTALPGALNKTAPTNGATNQATTLNLSWGASSGATSYEYCVDTVNDNACNAASWTSTASTTATVNGLAVNTTYYWQVRARNAAGTTDANAGTWWSFNTQVQTAPGGFAKTAPANGATGQASKNLTLSWAASSGASSYEYCVSTTNNTCASWTSTGTSRSIRINLSGKTTYYWQVRARNTAGTTDANTNTWWSFRTK